MAMINMVEAVNQALQEEMDRNEEKVAETPLSDLVKEENERV
ncbi:MAG: hypothetical protein ACE5FU_10700 [Nitrospinota bacterium]